VSALPTVACAKLELFSNSHKPTRVAALEVKEAIGQNAAANNALRMIVEFFFMRGLLNSKCDTDLIDHEHNSKKSHRTPWLNRKYSWHFSKNA
jgi:hypothetical protein